jgi:ankyrin repeat protein
MKAERTDGAMSQAQELFEAIKAGNEQRVRALLSDSPELASATDEAGVSAILTARYYGRRELAEWLAQQSPNLSIWEAAALGYTQHLRDTLSKRPELVNQPAPDGFSPLGLAAFFGNVAASEYLIAAGAEVDAASENQMQVRPLHSAVAHQDPDAALALTQLLVRNGADVNARQEGGWTPLHQAANRGHVEMTNLMLAHGADPTAKSQDGRTPRDLATARSHEAVIALLSPEQP